MCDVIGLLQCVPKVPRLVLDFQEYGRKREWSVVQVQWMFTNLLDPDIALKALVPGRPLQFSEVERG